MPSEPVITVIALLVVIVAGVRLVVGLVWHLFHRAGRWGIERLSAVPVPGRLRTPLVAGARRWPGPARFVRDRFVLNRFSGLPLTLFVVAASLIAAGLAGLVEEAFESAELLALDEALMAAIDPLRTPAVIAVFAWITALGNQETLTAVLIVATAMLAVHGPQRFILPLWIATIGAQTVSTLGKHVVARPRPDFDLPVEITTWSFPSGHATSAFSLYLLLAYVLTRDLGSARARFEIWFWALALAVSVALSRIIIGVHYPSDVAAGTLLGLFWLGLAIAIAELIKEMRASAPGNASRTTRYGKDSRDEQTERL